MKKAACVSREQLMSFGTCLGKFTKSKQFRLHITALEYLSPYAKHKVWLKANAEQRFLYGQHVLKSGLGRITEATPQYQGVIVYNMKNVPLGFGRTARSAADCRRMDPTTTVLFNQADCGEYIRHEDSLT